MATTNIPPIPNSQNAIVDKDGKPTKDFYNFLKQLRDAAQKLAEAS